MFPLLPTRRRRVRIAAATIAFAPPARVPAATPSDRAGVPRTIVVRVRRRRASAVVAPAVEPGDRCE